MNCVSLVWLRYSLCIFVEFFFDSFLFISLLLSIIYSPIFRFDASDCSMMRVQRLVKAMRAPLHAYSSSNNLLECYFNRRKLKIVKDLCTQLARFIHMNTYCALCILSLPKWLLHSTCSAFSLCRTYLSGKFHLYLGAG